MSLTVRPLPRTTLRLSSRPKRSPPPHRFPPPCPWHRFPTTPRLSTTTSTTSASSPPSNPSPSALLLGASLATLTATYSYLHHHLGGSRSLLRTLSFYSLAIPSYLHYRLHMLLDTPDSTWEALHKDTSARGLQKILELQGFYIKSGQMCAANIGNAFPPVWVDTMSVLQDECPARDFDVVRSIVEKEYGRPLADVFDAVEERPVGAASIGQVHRATLKGGGERVVVKVMYPDVEEVFRGDVRTIKLFARVAQPVHVPPLIEIEKQFMTEFDYREEARQLERVRENMIESGIAGDLCRIPRPYLELCTKRVLVMEELRGEKLVVELKRDMQRQRKRMERVLEKHGNGEDGVTEKFAKEFQLGENGPTAEEYDRLIALLDAKRRISNLGSLLFNVGVGWVPGVKKREYEDKSSLPINHAKLVDDLLYIHGNQILVDGCFNGDPHPGNILLLGVEEGKPQLGLIDYGQVKVLTKEERLLFCKIIVALANQDKEGVVTLLKQAGYKTKYMDPNIMYRFATLSYDEDNRELTEGKHIQVYMEHLHDNDPVEHLPQQYIMASRVSILLRGLGHAVHQSRSVAKAWKPIAEQELKKEGLL